MCVQRCVRVRIRVLVLRVFVEDLCRGSSKMQERGLRRVQARDHRTGPCSNGADRPMPHAPRTP